MPKSKTVKSVNKPVEIDSSSDEEQTKSKKSSKTNIQSNYPSSSQKSPNEPFNAHDYEKLSENENYRYLNNGKKVGHAVILKNEQGEKIAYQYAIPSEENGAAPKVRPLENIEEITRFGKTVYRATSPGRTPLYAKRYVHATVSDDKQDLNIDIGYFSESEKDDKEPFWGGSDKEITIFNNSLKKKQKKELKKELDEIKPAFKGGKEVVVEPESVMIRDADKRRKPDQNTVMGESAKDAYETFMDAMTEELSPEAKYIFKRAVDAPLKDAFKSNYRPEWLHAEGFSLTPMSMNPQRKDNLGAAPKWSNQMGSLYTEMMILERIAKWFALNRSETFVSIKPFF